MQGCEGSISRCEAPTLGGALHSGELSSLRVHGFLGDGVSCPGCGPHRDMEQSLGEGTTTAKVSVRRVPGQNQGPGWPGPGAKGTSGPTLVDETHQRVARECCHGQPGLGCLGHSKMVLCPVASGDGQPRAHTWLRPASRSHNGLVGAESRLRALLPMRPSPGKSSWGTLLPGTLPPHSRPRIPVEQSRTHTLGCWHMGTTQALPLTLPP